MKKLAMALLVVFVGVGIFGCGKESCSCENKEVETSNREISILKDTVWVLSVDIEKNNLLPSLSYIDKFFSTGFSHKGKYYIGEVDSEDGSVDRYVVAIESRKSFSFKNKQTIEFCIFVKNSSGGLLNSYDEKVMNLLKLTNHLVDDLEDGNF